VTDRLTGLQWEQKTDDGSIHDKDDIYTWTAGGSSFTAADGPAFTTFLATFNGGGCFAGQCDWRLPTRAELQTILDESYPCTEGTEPCIEEFYFGPTSFAQNFYWSSMTHEVNAAVAWVVEFYGGSVFGNTKQGPGYVRAVRGGL
jgi:hypothetical protein